MLAAIPIDSPRPPRALEHLFDHERDKLQGFLDEADEALFAQAYMRAAWAYRCAFGLLLEDFRRRDAVLPVAQRCALFAQVSRAWSHAALQFPQNQRDVAAMCRFIEGQRRRMALFMCP